MSANQKPQTPLQWVRHFLVYGFGVVSLAALSFVLVPVYTHRIPPGEYGVLELLNRTQDILGLAVMSGLSAAALAFFQFESAHPERKKKVFSTAFLGILANGALVCLLLFPFAGSVSQHLFGNDAWTWAVRIFLILIPFEVLFQIGLVSLQAEFRSLHYVTLSLARFGLGLTLNLILVLWLRWGIQGILIATLVHTCLPALFITLYTFARSGWAFEWELWKEMMRYGLPFIPGGIFLFILNSGDRYFLNLFHGAQAVGLYAVSYKLGYALTFAILAPFMKVWGPVMIEVALRPEGGRHIAQVCTHLATAYLYAGTVYALLAPWIVSVLTGKDYATAYAAIPVITLAYFFWIMSVIGDTAFYATKKTDVKPLILAAACVLCLSLDLILIPRYGAMGAASAALAGFACFAVLTFRVANRYLPIPLEHGRLATVLLAGIGLYLAGQASIARGVPVVATGVAAAVIFPAGLWMLGYWSQDERQWMKDFLGSAGVRLRSALRPTNDPASNAANH